MAKILGLKTGPSERSREFRLEDLSNDAMLDTALGDARVATFPAALPGDWTNQERASIYRALRLLQAAGVAVEADRGVSDDGSPWCVFCSAQGDVLVHIARIDHGYVLDGIGLEAPIRGRTFDELIDRFVGARRDEGTEERTAGLSDILDLSGRRDEKLFVHPAAQLAALFWAAMVVKDLATAQEIDAIRDPLADPNGDVAGVSPETEKTAASLDTRQKLPDRAETASLDLSSKLRDGGYANVMQSAGLMSLAYFLVGSEQLSPGAILERHVLELDHVGDATAAATEASASHTVFAQALEALSNVIPFLDEVFQVAVREATDVHDGNGVAEASIDMSDVVFQLTGMQEAILGSGLDHDTRIDLGAPPPADTQGMLPSDSVPTPVQQEMATTNLDDLLDFLQTAALDISPRFDVPTGDMFALIADRWTIGDARLDIPSEPPGFAAEQTDITDAEVIAAILQFLRSTDEDLTYYRSDDLHVIGQGEALSESGVPVQSFSWTFDDGSQIMLVGTAEDLAGFDLFA
jgi:hypothetical protein